MKKGQKEVKKEAEAEVKRIPLLHVREATKLPGGDTEEKAGGKHLLARHSEE